MVICERVVVPSALTKDSHNSICITLLLLIYSTLSIFLGMSTLKLRLPIYSFDWKVTVISDEPIVVSIGQKLKLTTLFCCSTIGGDNIPLETTASTLIQNGEDTVCCHFGCEIDQLCKLIICYVGGGLQYLGARARAQVCVCTCLFVTTIMLFRCMQECCSLVYKALNQSVNQTAILHQLPIF